MRKKELYDMCNKKNVARLSLAVFMGLCCMCTGSLGAVRVDAYAQPAASEKVPAVTQEVPRASERPSSPSIQTPSPRPSFLCTYKPGAGSSGKPLGTEGVMMPSDKPIDPAVTWKPSTFRPPVPSGKPPTFRPPVPSGMPPTFRPPVPSGMPPKGTTSPTNKPEASMNPSETYIPPKDSETPKASEGPSAQPVQSQMPPTAKPSPGVTKDPAQPAVSDKPLIPAKPSENTGCEPQGRPGGLLLPGLFHGEVGSYNASGQTREDQVLMPGILSAFFHIGSRTMLKEAEQVRGDIRHVEVKQVTRSRVEQQAVIPSETGDHSNRGCYILMMAGSTCLLSAIAWNKHRKKEEELL